MDADLLDLLMEKAPVKKEHESKGVGNHVDPLFQDAYDDFERASTSSDKAEALRLMIKLMK